METVNGQLFFQKYVWVLAIIIAVGGQVWPQLGLLVPVIMLILMGMSLFKGKYWCGNFCPHGSLFDHLFKPLSRQLRIPSTLRSKVVTVAVLLVFMTLIVSRFINVMQAMEGAQVYAGLGYLFVNTYLMVILLGGLLAVTVSPRAWCFACPMGTIQLFFYKIGKAMQIAQKSEQKVRFANPHRCSSCGKCEKVCPVQLSPYKGMNHDSIFEDDRCIKCKTCIQHCPSKTLCFSLQREV